MVGGSLSRGADQIALRIPLAGGTARAFVFPRLDSLVWSAPGAPPPDTILGFDPEDGSIAFVDSRGQLRRLDLRAGEVRLASRARLTAPATSNGSEIYGVAESGAISRITPSGDWSFDPPTRARWIFPQPDRSLIIAANDGPLLRLWLIRPTDEEIVKAGSLPAVTRGMRAQLGDRLYFTVDSGLVGVRARDLTQVKPVHFREAVQAMAATPSGDRLYVALKGASRLAVVDRYSESVTGSVALPGPASALRMDPLGQFILAFPAAGGDSTWIVAVGTNSVTGTVRSKWRTDLPGFAPQSMLATVRGDDVVFVSSATLTDSRTVSGGAKDFWYFFSWNGFRPRADYLDRPVTFDSPATVTPVIDSAAGTSGDTVPRPPLRDATPTMIDPPASIPPQPGGYMVSFAAVLSDQKAGEAAAGMTVNGLRPRVVATQSGSTTIYRVVLGPYVTREEADRVGRDSKRQYWVYGAAR